MQQIIMQPRAAARALPNIRLAVMCTKCGREVRRGDCGRWHPAGSAQMYYRRVPS